jgi:hypothetical protein
LAPEMFMPFPNVVSLSLNAVAQTCQNRTRTQEDQNV